MADRYRQVGSFESGRVAAVGVGDEIIAIGLEDCVEVVDGSRSVEIDHGERVVDVAVADRILVLSPAELTTYSRDGDRLWSQELEDAHAIAAITDRGLCGILGPDRFRAVDVATGRERFDVERSRPGGSDDDLLAVPTGFLIATWSFLTHVDADGEVDFDRDLSAVVRSVGRCEDAIVATLQSDQVVGIQAGTGELRWRTELEATHVAPVGEGAVLVRTADGIRAVDPEGTTEPVGDIPDGDVYATADGTTVCSVHDGTVSIHVHGGDRLSLAVATDTVGAGGTIDVEVTNPTDRERTVSLAVDAAGCSLSPSDRTVTVAPDETVLAEFPVAAVQSEGHAALEVAVDGSVTLRETIALEDATSGEVAVETDLEPIGIEDGVVELAVTVENVGDVALDSVRLLETGDSSDEMAPDETWTTTVPQPYEPDRRVSVGLEVVRGDRRREYAPTCSLPPAPTIDLEANGDVLRATVAVAGEVAVSDRLVLEVPGVDRVQSPVTIDGEDLLLVVPRYDGGTARIGFDAIDVDERIRLSGSGPFATPADSSDPRSQNRVRTERDETRESPANDSAPRADRGSPDAGTDPGLAVHRRVSDDSPVLGHAVRDRLVVENEGDTAADVSLTVDGDRLEVGPLAPGESTALERIVSGVSSDGIVLPRATLEADGRTVDRLSEHRLDVARSGVAVRAAVDPADGRIVADLANRTDRDCRVLGVELAEQGAESVGERLAAGETTTVSIGPDADRRRALEGDTAALSLPIRYADGEEETIDALAAVVALESGSAATESGSEDALLTTEIGSETRAAGEYGSVVLVFENGSDRTLSNVSVSATGDPIDETFYSAAHREVLEAGDWIEHFVDLEAGVDDPTFEATVEYALEDVEREYTVRASGPAVADEDDWTDDHLAAWSVDRIDESTSSTPSVPTLPPSLATPFRTR
ncbi:hypothetical protein [Natronobacterium texcoconense]|uniref:PQQ-like domain-containing protein n=1 Tax=Natronobacterium texcoconense TaxID=1095778 RepID=A0A1H1J2G8_NATTX|nr:hypothetical protein [Natronobacterium texcoconense]SDR44119.1 hypothetical protein SAMN04489842_4053 [Natronobacterium texcoconense]